MKTLDLHEASDLLKLHPSTVLAKARAGELPAAKPGKCWVFIDIDLLDWIRDQYTNKRQGVSQEEKTCYSNEKTSGTTNLRLVEKQYTDLLEPKTKKKLKN